MQLNLGTKIRELRHHDGRTQEALAEALGVTSQAVSRWESSGSYPDVEIIPSFANYFGVTIDELFGYCNDREIKIDSIIKKVNAFDIKSRGDDEWLMNVCPCFVKALRNFLRMNGCSLPLQTHCQRQGGDVTASGFTTMTRAIFNTIMIGIRKMSIGQSR